MRQLVRFCTLLVTLVSLGVTEHRNPVIKSYFDTAWCFKVPLFAGCYFSLAAGHFDFQLLA